MTTVTTSEPSRINTAGHPSFDEKDSPHLDSVGPYAVHKPILSGLDQLLVLDKNWVICVVNPHEKIIDYIDTQNAGGMTTAINNWKAELQKDSPNYNIRTTMRDMLLDYHVEARKAIGEDDMALTSYYEITSSDDTSYSTGQAPTLVDKVLYGFCGGTSYGKPGGGSAFTEGYRYYCYIQFPDSMVDGKTYTITLDNTDTVTFTYDRMYCVSRAIKVNQIGYLPTSTVKKAYMGAHLWEHGELDLSHATSFEVINNNTGEVVFTGTPSLIESNPLFDPPTNNDQMYGEDVYLLDFSALSSSETGEYFISVPGVGRSWPFKHKSTTFTQAFYTAARTLYHLRGNQHISTHYSNWARKKAKMGPYFYECDWHGGGSDPTYSISSITQTGGTATVTTSSAHGMSGNPYVTISGSDQPGYNLSNQVATVTSTTTFTYSVDAGTTTPATGIMTLTVPVDRFDAIAGGIHFDQPVKQQDGGWHDAADWDFNSAHFSTVFALLYAYEFGTASKHKDDRWNIPESGNGIPDILSEAEYGLKIWLWTQDENYGVTGYIDSWTHPYIDHDLLGQEPPGAVKCSYGLPIRRRGFSAEFAAAAAQFARLVAPFDTTKSNEWQTHAERSLDFAVNTDNRVLNHVMPCLQDRGAGDAYSVTYSEDASAGNSTILQAGCQWYLLTGENTYLTNAVSINAGLLNPDQGFQGLKGRYFWIHYSVIQASNAGYTALDSAAAAWEAWFTNYADTLVGYIGDAPYTFTEDRAENSTWSWGNSNLVLFNYMLEIAYKIDPQATYRTAQLYNIDFMFGCNPLGESWTTGIGYVYPVNIQLSAADLDKNLDPIPGVTIYGITGASTYENFRTRIFKTDPSSSGPASITSLTQTGGTATAVCAANHGLSTGDTIQVVGATQSEYNDGDPDDESTGISVTVTAPDTFTYSVDSGATTPATGSPVWRYNFMSDVTHRFPPFWRRIQYHNTANTACMEFTHHETCAPTIFALSVFMEDEEYQELKVRQDRDLYGQWGLM